MAKTCFKCKVLKPYDAYFKHTQTTDGYHSWCKICCTAGNVASRKKLNSTIKGRARVFLLNAKKSALKRNQEFSLTINDIVLCWEKQDSFCAYSGRKMTLESGALNTVSIERIDSRVGYTPDNTVLVCQAINRMKSDFAFDDFFDMCRDVAQFIGDDEGNLAVGAHK